MESRRKRKIIEEFLKRVDNATCMPGKKDNLKVVREKRQMYVLKDYLHNLYTQFKSEHPTDTTSLAFFCKSRPKNIRLVLFAERLVCLCLKHQNFGLKLISLSKALPPIQTITVIPDKFVEQYCSENCLEMLETLDSSRTIAFQECSRMEVEPMRACVRACPAVIIAIAIFCRPLSPVSIKSIGGARWHTG